MVAINGFETAEVAQKFRKDHKLTIPFVLGGSGEKGVSKVYGVVAYPTTYILDKDGIVRAQIVGGDTAAMKKVLAELGVK